MHPIIIIGSGLAGYNTAREIRQHNLQIPITMITQDGGAFYSKPLLSTSLAQLKSAESLMTMTADVMQEKLSLTILTHQTVVQINPQQQTICLGDQALPYSSLVLALGADTPIPPVTGDAANELLTINDVYQYQRFREQLQTGFHVALIGAGLVGCELANDLCQSGHKVTCIDQANTALSQLVPAAIGEALQAALHEHGVSWQLGRRVTAVDRHHLQLRVCLDNATSLDADIVVSATGLRPRIALAAASGIETNRGIVVNEFLETNMPHVYALGDCAELNGWLLPYVAPLMQEAKALGKTLTGEKTQVHFPIMPMSVKTTVYPITKYCPPSLTNPEWLIEYSPEGIRAKVFDTQSNLAGFILTKETVKERATMVSLLSRL